MFDPISAAIVGGATLIGGVLQNNSAKAQAKRQMEFQEDMSNTSYQRQMEDMRLAGLNPILSAKMGGASTPTGAAAPVQNVLGPAASSAVATQTALIQNDNTVANTAFAEANTAKSIADTYKTVVEAEKAKQEIQRSQAETQHGVLQKIGGRNLTDLVGSILNNVGDTTDIRQQGAEYNAGFRGNSAKSQIQPHNWRQSPNPSFKDFVFPEGTLLPPPVYK